MKTITQWKCKYQKWGCLVKEEGSLPGLFCGLTKVKYFILINKYPENKDLLIHWKMLNEKSINEGEGVWEGEGGNRKQTDIQKVRQAKININTL